MNISTIDLALQESKPLSSKTEAEGTDLFSILMASIAAGNGIQQGSYDATADGSVPTLTGQVTFTTVGEGAPGQDTGLTTGTPLTTPVAATTKEVTVQDTGAEPGVADLFAGLVKPASEGSQAREAVFKTSVNVGNEDPKGAILPVLEGKEQVNLMPAKGHENLTRPHLNPLPEGEETILFPPLQGEGQGGDGVNKVFSEQKGVISNPPEIKEGIQGKAPAVDLTAKAKTTDPSSVQLLLPQAVKGVKAGDGIEVKEKNLKAGSVVSGTDDAVKAKDSDADVGTVTGFGRETINHKLLHESAKPLTAVEGQRPQIDPVDLVAQISGRIKADFKSEGSEVRMDLHPESLGHLKIEIKVEGGVVKANIITENAMVKDAIDSNISMLRSSLEEHGLTIDQLSVGVDQHNSGNAFADRNDLQRWQGLEVGESSYHEIEEPANERRYSADTWQEQGVSIFA